MSLYPAARLRLLPENDTQPRIRPKCVILHSAGGGSELYGWWQNPQSKGLESHFWVGWDGEVVQYIDTEIRADANGEANGYAISIETASTVQAREPWTEAQLRALIDLCDWACTEHGIARHQMPTATSSGIGWHVMFGAPGPWTKARGKVCPGPARIDQVRNDIIPALTRATTKKEGGFLVALTEAEQREVLSLSRTIAANMPKRAFALRNPADASVWVFSDAGRWWVRNMDALSLLIWTGQVAGFGPEGVPLGTRAQFDGVPEIAQPADIDELVAALA